MLPDGWRQCRMGDLFESRRERGRPGLPLLSVTMNDGLVDREDMDRKQDSALAPEEHLLVKPGDIAYNMMRMWQGAFGLAHKEGLVSPAYVVLQPKQHTFPGYFARLFRTRAMLHRFWSYSHGLTDDRLRLYFDDFAAIRVHVPSWADQCRAAEILGCWDDAVAVATRLSEVKAVELALVRETLVASALSYAKAPLSDLAEVRTGLAKGKAAGGDAVAVPYLRVANVQDGRLDLKDVKYIEVPTHQVSRYALQAGDVLMTEGGDADKLGRGTVWKGEIDPCLHQNHVFAVRARRELVMPGYIAALAASEYGRSYFLACAKRSTNLASINSTQLRAFPVPLAPLPLQSMLESTIDTALNAVRAADHVATRLSIERESIANRLFTGRLGYGRTSVAPEASA
jgi:type I restriction enzyme S subunit